MRRVARRPRTSRRAARSARSPAGASRSCTASRSRSRCSTTSSSSWSRTWSRRCTPPTASAWPPARSASTAQVFVFDCPDDDGSAPQRRGLQPGALPARGQGPPARRRRRGLPVVPRRVRRRAPGPTTRRCTDRASTARRWSTPGPGCWPAACSTRPTTATGTVFGDRLPRRAFKKLAEAARLRGRRVPRRLAGGARRARGMNLGRVSRSSRRPASSSRPQPPSGSPASSCRTTPTSCRLACTWEARSAASSCSRSRRTCRRSRSSSAPRSPATSEWRSATSSGASRSRPSSSWCSTRSAYAAAIR